MTPELITFLILALVAFASALGMIVSRNAIYSALYLVLNFLTVAIFYLLLNAPFIALSQVAVYAGAIMVLFLFVIMLLGAEQVPMLLRRRQVAPPIALVLAMAGALVFWFTSRAGVTGNVPTPIETFGDPRTVGVELFLQYQLPFQITAVLLLVAMIGAIILTKKEKGG
jgi:NADH-quinone oxidoreductase subunit J